MERRSNAPLAAIIGVALTTLLVAAACAPAAPGEPGPLEYIFNQLSAVLWTCWLFLSGACNF